MNTYNYKNITLNVTNIDPNYIDSMGDTELTLKSEFVAELIENSCTFNEFFLRIQEEEIFLELEENEDFMIRYYQEVNEKIIVTNPDAIIAVYEYCLDKDRNFEFNVESENISWCIHDILHAVHDAAGCTIYVESEIEKERILESLAITKDQFPEELPNYEFLENLEQTFYNRFKESLDLENFMYLEFEEEY